MECMDLDEYRLKAYSGASGQGEKKISRPAFKKVNRMLDTFDRERAQQAEKENLEQAKIAARTGAWFEKKQSANSEDVKNAARNLTSGGLVKVPASSDEQDSIYRRVAKFLVIVGIDEAAKILPHLTESQTEKIIPEIASIRKITPEESAAILEEFESLVEKAREEGGLETARNILTKAYGSVKAEDVLKKAVQFPQGKPFDYLSDANAARIRILIESEPDSVKAIVLSRLEPKKAAQIISMLDIDTKKSVVLRLAKMKGVAPDVLAQIDKSLREKLLIQNTENSQNLDGRGVLAQILKRMDPGAENAIIRSLSEQDPQLGADLRKRLFTEEDVIGSDDRFIQNYLHDMEDRDIAILISGKSSGFREKILSNISKNRRKVILDEESMLHYLSKADSERMTSAFFSVLRRAWESGNLRVKGRSEEEVYV